MLRRASPASKKPVHWIITIGCLPPRINPAAMAIASPSRHARIRCRPGSACRAGSHRPSSLSGIQTTCVTPQPLRADATEGPSSMRGPFHLLLSLPLREGVNHLLPVGGVAGVAGVLDSRDNECRRLAVLLAGGRIERASVGSVVLRQPLPRGLVALARR